MFSFFRRKNWPGTIIGGGRFVAVEMSLNRYLYTGVAFGYCLVSILDRVYQYNLWVVLGERAHSDRGRTNYDYCRKKNK